MKLLELIKNEINQALNVKEIGIKNEYTLFFNVGSFFTLFNYITNNIAVKKNGTINKTTIKNRI